MALGFDVGTHYLICARRTGNEIRYSTESNAFIEFNINDKEFQEAKSKSFVIERGNKGYIVGQKAINVPNFRRTIVNGCLNSKDRDAFKILQIMCHSMIAKVTGTEVLYFPVFHTNANFHKDVLLNIFRSHRGDNTKILPFSINSGMALVYAELGDKQFSGIGISFGAGITSFCYSILKTEISSFSSTNAGDWITEQTSKITGKSIFEVEQEKKTIDLNKSNSVLKDYYQAIIDETVRNIEKSVVKKLDKPIDVIIAGGVALATGFIDLFKKALFSANLSMKIGEIRVPEDSLYTVARGCLIAAETSEV